MIPQIQMYKEKPPLFEPGPDSIWEEEHVAEEMLNAHLDPFFDGATRRFADVEQSVKWINLLFPSQKYPSLVDLGCGPGVYAEKFHASGYDVTALDISERFIAYGKQSAKDKEMNIRYLKEDYLLWRTEEMFHVAVMIYCDFGVLNKKERMRLLHKIYDFLHPDGSFVFDVFTPQKYQFQKESRTWESKNGGFWNRKPYLCLNSFFRYDEDSTVMRQHIVVTEEEVKCYHLWDHLFTMKELEDDIRQAGFSGVEFYGDVTGKGYATDSETICVVARK